MNGWFRRSDDPVYRRVLIAYRPLHVLTGGHSSQIVRQISETVCGISEIGLRFTLSVHTLPQPEQLQWMMLYRLPTGTNELARVVSVMSGFPFNPDSSGTPRRIKVHCREPDVENRRDHRSPVFDILEVSIRLCHEMPIL